MLPLKSTQAKMPSAGCRQFSDWWRANRPGMHQRSAPHRAIRTHLAHSPENRLLPGDPLGIVCVGVSALAPRPTICDISPRCQSDAPCTEAVQAGRIEALEQGQPVTHAAFCTALGNWAPEGCFVSDISRRVTASHCNAVLATVRPASGGPSRCHRMPIYSETA
jgi:hypothetical protein